MERRKNPEIDLRKKSGLFFQMGLLIAMVLCVSAFEYRSKETIKPIDPVKNTFEPEWTPPVTEIETPKRPPKPKVMVPVEVTDEAIEEEPDVIIDLTDLKTSTVEIEPEPMPIETAPKIFDVVETKPEPEGGFEGFYSYISKNLKYPQRAKKIGVEGKVYVQFIVDTTGELVDFKIIKGIGAGCDEEVLRVMGNAPKWKPGKQRGRAVKVRTVMPIYFQLN